MFCVVTRSMPQLGTSTLHTRIMLILDFTLHMISINLGNDIYKFVCETFEYFNLCHSHYSKGFVVEHYANRFVRYNS